jgi:ankyrin repeat protein
VACRGVKYDTGIWAVRYLVENGADVNAANMQGQTPMMNLYGGRYWDGNIPRFSGFARSYPYDGRVCTEQDAETLEVLLEAGADINAKDKWGNTLLHYIAGSSMSGSKEATELVMEFGTPDVSAVNNEGLTALDIAAKKNDETLVKFLLKYS